MGTEEGVQRRQLCRPQRRLNRHWPMPGDRRRHVLPKYAAFDSAQVSPSFCSLLLSPMRVAVAREANLPGKVHQALQYRKRPVDPSGNALGRRHDPAA